MKVGEFYVFRDCYRIDKDGKTLDTLAIFRYSENEMLWPEPRVGINCTKMPEGEGTSTKEVHRRFELAKRN